MKLYLAIPAVLLAATAAGFAQDKPAPLAIGSNRELFVDRTLVEKLDGAEFRLHHPHPAGVAIQYDEPWEGAFAGYPTVLKDGDTYRMYYRGMPAIKTPEVTCYAESQDGITWHKPKLGLVEWQGSKANNIVLADESVSHNFSPFVDTRPGVPDDERLKAVGGKAKTGLMAFASGDGIHWRKLQEGPIFRKGAFDSQNVAFWSEAEQKYLLYFRVFTAGTVDEKVWQPKGFRTVARSTSTNFLDWSEPERMSFGETAPEHLYTNQTQAYFRAPQIYIGLPMRFLPGRKVLDSDQAAALNVSKGYATDCAETVLLTSRGGNAYDREFLEGFLRPGTDLGNWASRAGIAALGIVPTGPAEMSIYKQAHYAQPSAHMVRYALRLDGFASINAPFLGGEFTTRPFTFSGKNLEINFSTGASGSIRFELQDAAGKPIPGFTLEEAPETIGDQVDRIVRWKGDSDLAALSGQPVRLRAVMKDADLYSIRFVE
jgi:hypothetical protein